MFWQSISAWWNRTIPWKTAINAGNAGIATPSVAWIPCKRRHSLPSLGVFFRAYRLSLLIFHLLFLLSGFMGMCPSMLVFTHTKPITHTYSRTYKHFKDNWTYTTYKRYHTNWMQTIKKPRLPGQRAFQHAGTSARVQTVLLPMLLLLLRSPKSAWSPFRANLCYKDTSLP